MQDSSTFPIADIELFQTQALAWANQFPVFQLIDSNQYAQDEYSTTDWLLAIDATAYFDEAENSWEGLKSFLMDSSELTTGLFSYDLKNQIEKLTSRHNNLVGFPLIYFFRPRYIIEIKGNKATFNRNYPEAYEMWERIMKYQAPSRAPTLSNIPLRARTPKTKYLENVEKIKAQIVAGDFYEMNYCCEFYNDCARIEPVEVFKSLNRSAKAPFTSLVKYRDSYALCASPERFLKKTKELLVSQPIKGTVKKGSDEAENLALKSWLKANEKERAENLMIVDLVRNDLAKSSQVGTIKVTELCEIYEFEAVNHMISTITGTALNGLHAVDIIKNAFPMGSMTGAPKIEVMKNIDDYEDQLRGLYSGAIGYITATGDFDFNVVIRSILYNQASQYLSIQVGSAITHDALPEQEYQELLLKANGLLTALGASID